MPGTERSTGQPGPFVGSESAVMALRPPFAPGLQPRSLDGLAYERRGRRRAALIVAIACFALLAVAATLSPAGAGHGTHRQLGLPPCGWVAGFGIPCPTCGMTTAFASAADGDLVSSFLTQPMGCILALATAAAALVSTYVAATGSAIGGHLLRLVTPKVGWWVAGLILAAWIYKVIVFR